MRKFNVLISAFICFALALILMGACIARVQSQSDCEPYRGALYQLGTLEPELPNVTLETLTNVDAYLRSALDKPEATKIHVIGFVENVADFDAVLQLGRDFTGYSGLTIQSYGWDWATCSVNPYALDKADLSLMLVFDNDATMFGLIVHELAHSVNSTDEDVNNVSSSIFWERVANWAWNDTCAQGNTLEVTHCDGLRSVLNDTG